MGDPARGGPGKGRTLKAGARCRRARRIGACGEVAHQPPPERRKFEEIGIL